eukprot:13432036-Ditylum_brightwellii.AAC.1
MCLVGNPLLVMTCQLKKKNATPSSISCSAIKKEYCILVSNEPDGLFQNGSLMNHRFINKIENAKRLTGVDESTF